MDSEHIGLLRKEVAQTMLRIGVSSVDITPPVGISLDGFASREPSSIGVHDRLKAISLVISDGEASAALVSCDLLDIDASLVKAIREEATKRTSLQKNRITVACTHTHYGPTVSEFNAFFGRTGDVATYRGGLKYYLSGAIQEALRSMREANLGVGWGASSIGVNRRQKQPDGSIILGQNPDKPIDRRVGVIKFSGTDSKPSGCVVNFACHPVSQTWRMRFISADYPGKMREVVESLTGGPCMFLQGACGNINPILMDHSYEPARRLGTRLGCEVVKVWENVEPEPAETFGVASDTIRIPRYNYGSKERAEAFVEKLEKELKKWQAERAAEGLINWTKLRHNRALEALQSWSTGKPMPDIDAEIQAWNIGDVGIAFVPGEVFNEIGAYVKEHSPFSSTFFVGYANGNIGYVPTHGAYGEGGYEVNDACQVSPEAADLITEKCLDLLEKLHQKT